MGIKPKIEAYSVDEYGVVNYKPTYLAIITLLVLYSIIAVFSFLLLYFEQDAQSANILNYQDAFWTLQMSASTIGFGDLYPVTLGGRIIVALMFYIGVGMVGFIGAQFVNHFVGFSDTNIKNRELRQQNIDLLTHNKKLEEKIDSIVSAVERQLTNDKP